MAYNNGFPMNYPQYYYPQPQQMQQQVQASQPQQNSIIWVQGEAGAKSYLVAPNTTVQLWDSEDQVIYLKSADASGMPSIRTLDYKVREMPGNSGFPAQPINVSNYVTKAEFEAIKAELEHIKANINKTEEE